MVKKFSEDEIRSEIFHLADYHKYWQDKSAGIRNPNIDTVTYRLMDFKDIDHPNHETAINFFAIKLKKGLPYFLDKEETYYVAIVPSHKKGIVSAGLIKLVKIIKKTFPYSNKQNPLERHKDIIKLASGGDRCEEVHLESINVVENIFPKGAKILLMDDVTTTGNSMKACEQLLYDAGAGLVICIALLETVEE